VDRQADDTTPPPKQRQLGWGTLKSSGGTKHLGRATRPTRPSDECILRFVKVTELDDFIAVLRAPEVQNLAKFFARNLARADDLRYMYLHLIFPNVMAEREMKVMTQVIKERAVERVMGSDDRFTPEFLKEVYRRVMEDGEEAIDSYLARGARERVENLTARDPQFGRWLNALQQNAATALWSAFEALASDLWIQAVNSRPDLFAKRVMQQFSESLQRHGLSSRSIPLGVAAKYSFDLRHHIGDIIADVIDFTSLDVVRKAYKSAFGIDEEGQRLLEADRLRKLVLIRNLVVHRGGVVDVAFKERTGCPDKVGDELTIDEDSASQFVDAVKAAGLYILKLVDSCLATASA